MGDIALTWNPSDGAADLSVIANDLARDGGLETAVLLSLFCDRRALEPDTLPDGNTDRGGWWGDAVPNVADDRIGSRLWLLRRAKQTQETLNLAREYAREALQWLLDDKVAAALDVLAVNLAGVLTLQVGITRPTGDQVRFAYKLIWNAQAAQG